MPLPLDGETREFGEEFLHSLKTTLDWIHGRCPNPCVNQDIHNWIDGLKAEAEMLRCG
jgi:hypothetical protein